MNSKLSTKEVIEKIHHEFNTSGEELLKEAQSIINETLLKKASRLAAIGFTQCIEVNKFFNDMKSKDLVDNIVRYNIRYPNNKFITEDKVKQINSKYGLVCAPIDRFKGFVPEVKLKLIEDFNLDPSDLPEKMITNVKFSYLESQASEIRKIKQKYPTGIYPMSEGRNWGSMGVTLSHCYISSYVEIENQGLVICAPRKDFNLKGLLTIGQLFMKFTTIEVPDPVVLQPVKGGYLILAAWGDEASDEIIVNQTMN
jgi:hypothetical protein